MHHILHLSHNGHLGELCFLAIANLVAINMNVHVLGGMLA